MPYTIPAFFDTNLVPEELMNPNYIDLSVYFVEFDSYPSPPLVSEQCLSFGTLDKSSLGQTISVGPEQSNWQHFLDAFTNGQDDHDLLIVFRNSIDIDGGWISIDRSEYEFLGDAKEKELSSITFTLDLLTWEHGIPHSEEPEWMGEVERDYVTRFEGTFDFVVIPEPQHSGALFALAALVLALFRRSARKR